MRADMIIAIGGENLIDSVHTTAPDGKAVCTHNLGGSPYNVAIALARQGLFPYYITPISTDAFGDRLAVNLKDQGVVLTGERRDEPTTQAIVTLNHGVPHYVFRRENTAERCITVGSIAAAMPRDATHFHIGSLAFAGGEDADVWEQVFHNAAANGLTTSIDPNVRASLIYDPDAFRARFERLLASATIIKLSDEDLAWIYPDQAQEEALSNLRDMTKARLVALTKGADGAECWTSGLHCSFSNPPGVPIVDTIGAGDTFMATVLAQLSAQNLLSAEMLERMTPVQLGRLLQRSVHAAVLNCAKEGCDPPSSDAIDAAIERGLI